MGNETIDTTAVETPPAATPGDSLRKLAEFYDQHPDLPAPRVSIYTTYGNSAVQIAALVDGQDEVTVTPGITKSDWWLCRTFGSIEVRMLVDAKDIGEERPVPATVTEVVVYSVDELRGRAELVKAARS